MRACRTVSTIFVALVAIAGCDGDKMPMVRPAETYCKDLLATGCVRAFECVPPADRNVDFYTTYGTTMEECQAFPNRCADLPAVCPDFNPAIGAICLSDFMTQTCGQLLIIQNGVPVVALPSSCSVVCPP